MKKIIFIFFIISFLSFSSPEYNFRFTKASLIKVKLSRKKGGFRWVSGIIKNNTNEIISNVEFTVQYKDKNTPYLVVGKMNFYNLQPKEKATFSGKLLNVQNIKGRDFKIKLTKIIMKN